ncbi:MAG: ankyrin repeat domain-containing protein [Candidatus Babeliales bacterium]|jgi:ankyrin repeat protein
MLKNGGDAVSTFRCLCFLAPTLLCVGLQAGIKDAIDNNNVEELQAALKADPLALNTWSITTHLQDRLGNTISIPVTPLMYAVMVNASVDIINALFAAGANPEIQDTRFGDTALHHAVRNKNQKLARLILKHAYGKSLTDIKNFSGFSPLDEAQGDIKKLLKKYETLSAKFNRVWRELGGTLPHDPDLVE